MKQIATVALLGLAVARRRWYSEADPGKVLTTRAGANIDRVGKAIQPERWRAT